MLKVVTFIARPHRHPAGRTLPFAPFREAQIRCKLAKAPTGSQTCMSRLPPVSFYRVRPCVPCVSRVCPGSPRCLFTVTHTVSHSVSFVAVPRAHQKGHTKIPVQYAAVNSTSRKNMVNPSTEDQEPDRGQLTGGYGELRVSVWGSQSYRI